MPLYVVATPIGNLGEISARALKTLEQADLIAAEDTRRTRALLSHFGIRARLKSYHAHSPPARLRELLDLLRAGDSLALVSDAGTPGISDPGGSLIRAAVEAGVPVIPISGPCAPIAALSASGLDPSRFVFEGFLSRSKSDRTAALDRLRALPHTLIFFESAGRLERTLRDLAAALGDRQSCLAREVSKLHEEFLRGPLSELAIRCRESELRGECVILVAGASGPTPVAADAWTPRLQELIASGVTASDAARLVSAEFGLPRRLVYARATSLRREGGET